MKKITITILLIIIAMKIFAQNIIPNANFENWADPLTLNEWENINIYLPTGYYGCVQSVEAYEGDYAMMLRTIDMDGTLVPGVATTGNLDYYMTTGGVPYTLRPNALKAFIKHPSSGDQVLIAVQFFKDGIEIGDGALTVTDQSLEYQEIYIPINYYEEISPDTMNITILTDAARNGSTLIIDQMEFDFTSAEYESPAEDLSIKLFPNPATNYAIIETKSLHIKEISVMDLSGRRLKSVRPDNKSYRLSCEDLGRGIYFINVITKQGAFTENLIIQ